METIPAQEDPKAVDLIMYSRDELLSHKFSPLAVVRPNFDIEVDVMIWKRDTPEEDFKRRRDPRERTRRENDGIVLSPQRGANFKLGCSVPTTIAAAAALPQQQQQRRIGSGRLLAREWETADENFHPRQQGNKNEWARDRKKLNTYGNEGETRKGKQQNGGPRNDGESNRQDTKNQRQGKNSNCHCNNRRQSDDKRNNRNNGHGQHLDTPEWFTAGPTSRNDRIDLHGFDEFFGDDEEHEKSPESDSSSNPPAANSGLPDIVQDTSVKTKRENSEKKENFNFDDFMKINISMPTLSGVELEHKEGHPKAPKSRFSQFFSATDNAETGACGPDVGAAFISAWCKDQPERKQGPKMPDMENLKMRSVDELEKHVLASARPMNDEQLSAEFISRPFRGVPQDVSQIESGNMQGMCPDLSIMASHMEENPGRVRHMGFMPHAPGMGIRVPLSMEHEHFMHQQQMHQSDMNITEEQHKERLVAMLHSPQGLPHGGIVPNMDDQVNIKMGVMPKLIRQNEDIGHGVNNPGRPDGSSPIMGDEEHMAAKFSDRRQFHGQGPPMMPQKHHNPLQGNPIRPSLLFSPQFVEGMSTLPPELRFLIAQAYPSAEMLSRPEFMGIVAGVQHGTVCPSHLINIFAKTHNIMPPRQRETFTAVLHYIWALHRGANAVNVIPNRDHLVAHTANIMQNALIKKKLEEQAENFKKRQDGELAFTPTAVLRKMTNGPYSQEMTNEPLPQQLLNCSDQPVNIAKNMIPPGQFPAQGNTSPSNLSQHMSPNFRGFPPQGFPGPYGPPRSTGPDGQWWNQEGMGRVIRHALPPGLPPPRSSMGRQTIGNDAMSMMTVEELERNQQFINENEGGM